MGTLYVPANKLDPQAFGSALTYARRYALMTAFGVPAEDDDGNAAARSTPAAANNGEARKAKLDGTYDTLPKLETAAKEFVRTLNGMDDLESFLDWIASPDVDDFIIQLKRDLPDWWNGGPGVPQELVPLRIQVANKKRDLEQIDELRNRERNVLQAG
jgi:hypothetical protein